MINDSGLCQTWVKQLIARLSTCLLCLTSSRGGVSVLFYRLKTDIYFTNLVRTSAIRELPATGCSHTEFCLYSANVLLLSCRPSFSCILRTTWKLVEITNEHQMVNFHIKKIYYSWCFFKKLEPEQFTTKISPDLIGSCVWADVELAWSRTRIVHCAQHFLSVHQSLDLFPAWHTLPTLGLIQSLIDEWCIVIHLGLGVLALDPAKQKKRWIFSVREPFQNLRETQNPLNFSILWAGNAWISMTRM